MEPRDGWYKFYTKDHDSADAQRRFVEAFGQPPMRCFIDHGVLLVGPIPDEQSPSQGRGNHETH